MKRLLFTLILFPALFGTLKADHVVGSDILYRCLGNGKYEIIFKFYRDCNGCNVAGGGGGGTGQVCPHPVLTVTGDNGSCTGQNLGTVNITRQSIKDITQLCGSTQSKCAGGSFPYGIEEHYYTGIIDLSTNIANGCCKFKISTTIYVRSTTITTGAANAGFYTDATIDACNNICNNSPAYTSYPVAIICVGQDFVFNNGAIDTLDAGDSLSYNLAPAYQGPGSQVGYTGSFSATKPMTFLGFPNAALTSPAGFRLDSLTGDLSFRPIKLNETGVIVIEVIEWRKINGVMKEIGRTRRDMQVIVVDCPDNKIPKIDPPFTANACAGQQVCMSIVTSDPDVTRDSVKISWNRGIPRATFSNNNGVARFASGQVCWTPLESDVSSIPHTFTITAKDNACPLNGIAIRSFSIYVKETPKATRSFTKLTCGEVIMSATPFKTYPGGLVKEWRVRDSTDKIYYFGGNTLVDTVQMKPGRNVVTLILKTNAPCVNAFSDTIFIDPYVQVSLPNDTNVCAGNTMSFNSTTKLGKAPYSYQWSTSATDTLTSLSITPTSDTAIYITVFDDEGCTNTDTVKMFYKPLPLVNIDPDSSRICFSDYVQVDAGNDTFPKYTYLWSNNDTGRIITVKDSNTYGVAVKDSLGCVSRDTFRLYVNQVPVYAGPDKSVCYNDTLKITGTGADNYKWYKLPSGNQMFTSAGMQEVLTQPSDYRLWGSTTYKGLMCENSDTVSVSINQLPVVTFGNIVAKCENAPPFDLAEGLAFPTLVTGTWSCLDDPDWVKNNYFYPDSVIVTSSTGIQPVRVLYKVTDGNGCKNSNVTTFNVIQLPVVNVFDTSVCSDRGYIPLKDMVLPPTSIGQGTWSWSSTNPQGSGAIDGTGQNARFNLSAAPQGNVYELCLQVVNSYGCINSSCLELTSRVVPVVDAGFITPVCENDTVFALNVAASPSPTGGTWQSASGGIINTDWFNPALVTPGSTYNLTYTYDIPGNRCPVTDSVSLTVKSKPVLNITPFSKVCANKGVMHLMDSVTPAGGVWLGADISLNGDFDAAQHIGTSNFRYDYQALNGCKNYLTASIAVQEIPTVSINQPGPACIGTPFQLSAQQTVATGVQWSTTGDGNFDNTTALAPVYTAGNNDNAAGTVDVIVTTTGNDVCPAASKTIKIGIFPFPSADIVADTLQGCEPLTVQFNAITDLPDNAKYEWDFGDPQGGNNASSQPDDSHAYLGNGTYPVKLKVTSKDGCAKSASTLNIVVHPVPVAAIDASKWVTTILQNTIEFYDKTTIDAPGVIKDYLWDFGDLQGSTSTQQNPVFTYPTDSGIYNVHLKVISDKGCESETNRTLVVEPYLTTYIPNAFMPGTARMDKNNRFYVTSQGYESFYIAIFSRWGEVLYESKDITEGWDGNYKGEPVEQDVYVYYVKLTGPGGKAFEYKGTVTLLR